MRFQSWTRLLFGSLAMACLWISVVAGGAAAQPSAGEKPTATEKPASGEKRPAEAADAALSLFAAVEDQVVSAIAAAEVSVVAIARDPVRKSDHDDFQPEMPGRQQAPDLADPNYVPKEFGAGIILSADGLILTNYHVVKGGPVQDRPMTSEYADTEQLYVRLHNRRGMYASIIAADPRSDLAVIRIPASGLTPIRFGNADNLRKGQFVLALGNPYAMARGGSASASIGIVSNVSRSSAIDLDSSSTTQFGLGQPFHNFGTLLHIDTRLNLGTSGGAVVNMRGELIGMATSLAAIAGYEKSVGFAIPMDTHFRRIVETLRRGEEVEYGYIGIRPDKIQGTENQQLLLEKGFAGGVEIGGVVKNGPADRGGLDRNDWILQINGRPIAGPSDLMREIGLLQPGTEATVLVHHSRMYGPAGRPELQLEELKIVAGKFPVLDEEALIFTRDRRPSWRGMTVDFSSARDRYLVPEERIHFMPPGVVVRKIVENSPAGRSGLREGDFVMKVNNRDVNSPAEFDLQIAELKDEEVTLLLYRNRRSPPDTVIVRGK